MRSRFTGNVSTNTILHRIDFDRSEDLVKFPVLTKAELRAWMKEMYDTHPESRDSWDATSTSGSTGVPLTLYQSQREHACTNANWIPRSDDIWVTIRSSEK